MDTNKLQEIIKRHQKWLNGEEGGERANMRGSDLRGVDLICADLRGADLRYADMMSADLRGACLRSADMSYANLRDADMRRAGLFHADLRGADLRSADMDYSCWPLWCGATGVKVDRRIAAQLAAHFCALDCDDQDYIAARDAILEFAKTSHRADDLGLTKSEE